MASLSDILSTVQNGVTAMSAFGKQLQGSLNNISSQLTNNVRSIAGRTGAFTLNGGSGLTNTLNDIQISQGSSSQFGAVKVDGTSVTAAAGVLSATAVTKTQQQTGTLNTAFATPLHQQDHDSATKAWVSWSSTGTIQASYNVTSVTRTSLGSFTIVFTTSFANTNYACHLSWEAPAGTSTAAGIGLIVPSSRTVSQVQVTFTQANLALFADPTSAFLVCHGRQ